MSDQEIDPPSPPADHVTNTDYHWRIRVIHDGGIRNTTSWEPDLRGANEKAGWLIRYWLGVRAETAQRAANLAVDPAYSGNPQRIIVPADDPINAGVDFHGGLQFEMRGSDGGWIRVKVETPVHHYCPLCYPSTGPHYWD